MYTHLHEDVNTAYKGDKIRFVIRRMLFQREKGGVAAHLFHLLGFVVMCLLFIYLRL